MKKNLLVLGIALVVASVIITWVCYDLKKDPSPIYIPGRDTIEEWDDGVCEIIGTPILNELRFLNQTITSRDNSVKAYKKVDHEIFFIMTNGKIVINLEAATYYIYENSEPVDRNHSTVFDDYNSFVWLSAD